MKAVVRAALCAFFPAAGGLPGLAEMRVHEFVEDTQRDTSGLYWLGVVLASWAWVATPLLTIGVPLPAPLLGERLRDKHTNKMASSRIYFVRQAAYLVRLTAGMLWGQDERVRRHFHLEPYPADPGTFRA